MVFFMSLMDTEFTFMLSEEMVLIKMYTVNTI